MKTHITATSIRRSILAGAFLALTTITSHAAVVTWGAATNINPAGGAASDLDVSTTPGTVVGAFNLGPVGVPSTTINTVTFNPFAVPLGAPSVTVGNFTLATAGAGGLRGSNFASGAAPFSNLSASYQNLLVPQAFTVAANATMTLTMSGLNVGQNYEFQWWSDQSVPGGGITSAAAGNTVTLNSNTTAANGGLGQFALGTFTADALSQAITFTPGGGQQPQLNGFQLRQTAAAAVAVPEPGSALAGMLALGVCLSGLAGRSRGKVLSS